jgi:hypothetical protein
MHKPIVTPASRRAEPLTFFFLMAFPQCQTRGFSPCAGCGLSLLLKLRSSPGRKAGQEPSSFSHECDVGASPAGWAPASHWVKAGLPFPHVRPVRDQGTTTGVGQTDSVRHRGGAGPGVVARDTFRVINWAGTRATGREHGTPGGPGLHRRNDHRWEGGRGPQDCHALGGAGARV